MTDQSSHLTFEVGKKYKNRDGAIVECVAKTNHVLMFGESRYTTWPNGLVHGHCGGSGRDIVSEYIEPKQENVPQLFDWTKPAQTKLGIKVKALHNFGSLADKYPLVGILQGGAASNSWTLEGKSYSSKDYDLINIPEPKKVVPLEPGDIKPGDVIKQKSNSNDNMWSMVTSVSKYINGLPFVTCTFGTISVVSLVNNYLISHDNGVTWEECFKEG